MKLGRVDFSSPLAKPIGLTAVVVGWWWLTRSSVSGDPTIAVGTATPPTSPTSWDAPGLTPAQRLGKIDLVLKDAVARGQPDRIVQNLYAIYASASRAVGGNPLTLEALYTQAGRPYFGSKTPPVFAEICPGSPCVQERSTLVPASTLGYKYVDGQYVPNVSLFGSFDDKGAFLPSSAGLDPASGFALDAGMQYYADRYPLVIVFPANAASLVENGFGNLFGGTYNWPLSRVEANRSDFQRHTGGSDAGLTLADMQALERHARWDQLKLFGYCVSAAEPQLARKTVRGDSESVKPMHAWRGSSAVSMIPAGSCVMTFDGDNGYMRTVYYSPDSSIHSGWMSSDDLG